MWTIWTSLPAVRERPLNLITHSLTLPFLSYHQLIIIICHSISCIYIFYHLKCPEKTLHFIKSPRCGVTYVFSSFPPRPPPPRPPPPRPRPPPRPPPQQLLPLTSKPFQLNLRYLAQRIYGSGEMYWMTFPWPWPNYMDVASISKNLLVCVIKWELLIRSLQNVAALLPWSWLLPD